jgi:hypothetical protein
MNEEYYFDTCTIIDLIDDNSVYKQKVTTAINQIQGLRDFSEYMENELKGVLRHAEKFIKRRDKMLSEYAKIKQTLNTKFIPNTELTLNLHYFCKKQRIPPLKFQDMVHIGICSLENVPNIVSDDRHIFGRDRNNRPFIQIVRERISVNAQPSNNPRRVFTTRTGSLRMEI